MGIDQVGDRTLYSRQTGEVGIWFSLVTRVGENKPINNCAPNQPNAATPARQILVSSGHGKCDEREKDTSPKGRVEGARNEQRRSDTDCCCPQSGQLIRTGDSPDVLSFQLYLGHGEACCRCIFLILGYQYY